MHHSQYLYKTKKLFYGYTKKGDIMANLSAIQIIKLLDWRDFFEIIAFSTLFYYVSLWLKKDKRTNLLSYFYGYCCSILLVSMIDFQVLFYVLTTFAPVIVLLFIVMHQETLQKNFVSLYRYTPAHHVPSEWQEELIRSMCIAHNKGKNLRLIIEHNQKLDGLITAPFVLDSPFHKDLMSTVIHSDSFKSDRFIWLRSDGTIASINTTILLNEIEHNPEVKELPSWQQQALMLNNKTKSICIAADENSEGFTVITQNSILSPLSTGNCLKLLKKHVISAHTYKKGNRNETAQSTQMERHNS